jgi:hypothetical protein
MIAKLLVLAAVAAGIWIWWRRHTRRGTAMSAVEARSLLGVGEAATLQEVRDAHRRLIAKVHPDAGGSAELATRVNTARDTLVADLNKSPTRRG